MASIISAGTTTGTALSLTSDTSGELQIRTNNGSTTAMTLTTGGNVGIGTTTPGARISLTSTGNTTADGIRLTLGSEARSHNIYSNISTGRDLLIAPYRAITLQAGAGTTEGEVRLQSYESTIISTGSSYTERMRIDSSGNVGIKNTSPQGTLDVGGVGSSNAGDLLVTTGSTTAEVVVGRQSSVSSDNTNFRVRNRVNQQAFFVNSGNGTAQVRFTFGVGDTTPATSGAGITFPATQSASSDANTLDDYEEGTWTPTISGTSAVGTGTYSVQIGRYTKIGNQVTISAYISWSAHTGTGGIHLSNLPFSTLNATNAFQGFTLGYLEAVTLNANNIAVIYSNINSTNANLVQYPAGGGSIANVAMDTAGGIIYSATYMT